MKHIHKKIILSIILCILMVISVSCSSEKENTKAVFNKESYKDSSFLYTAEELKKNLNSKDIVLVDCNKPEIYKKEHIPGAISLGLHGFSDKVGQPGDPNWGTIKKKEDLVKTLEKLGIDNKKTIVFYSNVFKGPGADGRAVWQLKMAGMDNVKFLVGGLSNWKELGYETTDVETKPTPVKGVALKDYDKTNYADKEFVKANLDKMPIIDVRTEKEYKGSQKAGEPRGGHIKGAKNMLWLELLNKDGTIKSPEAIKEKMASLGVKPDDEFVVY
ncbi:MAG: rhodanese-like domain-containing protein [Clostridium sp.]